MLDFIGAYSKTIRELHGLPEARQFANHLLPNKLHSKEFLAKHITIDPQRVLLLGSWYPTLLPYLISKTANYTCVDIDDSVIETSKLFNKNLYGSNERFEYITADAKAYLQLNSDFDLIINTSCEHMPFDMKDVIWNTKPLYAFQSNNYIIPEHINYKNSIYEFIESTGLNDITYSGTLSTDKYDRYTVIGKL